MKKLFLLFILSAALVSACGPGNQEHGPKNQHKDRTDTTDNNPHNDGPAKDGGSSGQIINNNGETNG